MITLQRAHELLMNEDGSLYWKHHPHRSDLIGKRAGHINNGYWRLAIDGQEYYAAQIVWLMTYSEWPDRTVDHIDPPTTYDGPSNLRLATKAQNIANSGMNIRNTSGLKGVSFCSATGKWRASIRIDGREK